MSLGSKVFIRKGVGPNLYKWSPQPTNFQKTNKEGGRREYRPYFCNATPNSQGEDWINTYCYNIVLVNSQQTRVAYVACDYVE